MNHYRLLTRNTSLFNYQGRPALRLNVTGAAVRFQSKMRVLCVAEKPSIAKAVAEHLSGGRPTVVSIP
jgi:hypothetical protein